MRVIESSAAGFYPINVDECEFNAGNILGYTPIVDIDTYNDRFAEIHAAGGPPKYSPMRGSKRGIAIRRGHGLRRYEYNYYLAYWFGARIACRYIKTNNRFIELKVNKTNSLGIDHHSVRQAIRDNLRRGFNDEYFDNKSCKSRRYDDNLIIKFGPKSIILMVIIGLNADISFTANNIAESIFALDSR